MNDGMEYERRNGARRRIDSGEATAGWAKSRGRTAAQPNCERHARQGDQCDQWQHVVCTCRTMQSPSKEVGSYMRARGARKSKCAVSVRLSAASGACVAGRRVARLVSRYRLIVRRYGYINHRPLGAGSGRPTSGLQVQRATGSCLRCAAVASGPRSGAERDGRRPRSRENVGS